MLLSNQFAVREDCSDPKAWRKCMPALITHHRHFGSVSVVDLRGSLGLGEGSMTLGRTIRDLIESGRTKIILNFREVNFIDSAGVGELAGAYMPVKSKGGELKFLNPTKKILGVLQITQLDKVFEVHMDEQTAIQSFS